ncbi:hypothetical protein [Chryseobacterium koreense]|uniref:hypothetical protein n=1 Tax=Chryseobacterium koreense TaxID=232216 RepID=UPI0026EC2944|nr:hypothetical protein [Chryseobacterium koreense]
MPQTNLNIKYYLEDEQSPIMSKQDFVYLKIGMALISAQRVEFITAKLIEYLSEFNQTFAFLTTEEFLEKTAKSKNGKRTLGAIFNLLKLNPKLVIEAELDTYLKKRNILAHNFWQTFLQKDSTGKEAVDFCYDFGRHSERIESFFKGFIYFLALRFVKDRDHLEPELKKWSDNFDYFIISLKEQHLK